MNLSNNTLSRFTTHNVSWSIQVNVGGQWGKGTQRNGGYWGWGWYGGWYAGAGEDRNWHGSPGWWWASCFGNYKKWNWKKSTIHWSWEGWSICGQNGNWDTYHLWWTATSGGLGRGLDNHYTPFGWGWWGSGGAWGLPWKSGTVGEANKNLNSSDINNNSYKSWSACSTWWRVVVLYN